MCVDIESKVVINPTPTTVFVVLSRDLEFEIGGEHRSKHPRAYATREEADTAAKRLGGVVWTYKLS